jgi:DNA-binding NarL/FixJ family response regulator
MNATDRIRVAIVEDNRKLRLEMADVITGQATLECVATCPSAEEALRQLPGIAPDVVLMDIHLGGLSGIDCTRELKQKLPETQILMVTMFDDSDKIFAALRAGASGYLLKRFASVELLSAIQEAHAGGSPMTPQIARQVVQAFQDGSPAPKPKTHGEMNQLTERERELLSLMARGKHYKEVADTLDISTDTVRSHIRRIYKKLQVHSRTEAVVKFLGEESS